MTTADELRRMPPVPRFLKRLTDYLAHDFLGGPRLLRMSWIINLHKGATFAVMGGLMWFYANFSAGAWVYLALHGSYGLIWLIKAATFPDRRWERRVTFGGAFVISFGVLLQYWAIGWMLISRDHIPDYPLPDFAWFALCIALHTIGCAVMVAADAQKNFVLKERPGLITDGLFRYIRHPNYAGEIMIYGSYVLMLWHWYPALVLLCVVVLVFWPGMSAIEASLARYPDWPAYRARTGFLLPRMRV